MLLTTPWAALRPARLLRGSRLVARTVPSSGPARGSANALLFLCAAAWALPASATPTTGIRDPGTFGPPGHTASAPQAPASPLARKLQAAHEALAAQRFDQARTLFEEAAALDRLSPQPLLGLAELARVRGLPAEVKRWLDQALKLSPADAAVLSASARLHYAQRDYRMAETLWNKALVADPKAAGVLVDLGDLQLNVHNKPAEAAALYQRALVLNPQLAGAHFALGVARAKQGQGAQALSALAEAARLSPGNPLPLHAAGQVHAALGQLDLALAAYDKALQAQPAFYAARLDKGDALLAAGRTEAAVSEFNAVVQSQPSLPAGHVKLGQALHQQGRRADAMKAYQAALALDARQPLALNNLAWLAAEGSEVADRGLSWAEQAVALNKNEPRFQGTLAWVHFKRGDTAKAQQLLEQLTQGNGKTSADAHYLLGVVRAARGQAAPSAAAFKEALRLNPNFSQAADARARLQAGGKPG